VHSVRSGWRQRLPCLVGVDGPLAGLLELIVFDGLLHLTDCPVQYTQRRQL